MVSDHFAGYHATASQGLTKKRFGIDLITFVVQQHIHDLPVLVHITVYVKFSLAAKAACLVNCPFRSDPLSVKAHYGSGLRAKCLYLIEHGARRDVEVALG